MYQVKYTPNANRRFRRLTAVDEIRKERRKLTLQADCNAHEFAIIAEVASQHGMGRAEFIRNVLLPYCERWIEENGLVEE